MEHCYSYDFTKKHHKIPYQGCKLFKIKLKEFEDFDDFDIRSVIDHGSLEFELRGKGFEECKDIETDKAWFKLMHLLFGFLGDYDVKKKIEDDIKRHSRDYSDYSNCVKETLCGYIELLRTGVYSHFSEREELYEKMTVEELVDLLEEELRLRATIYRNSASPKSVIVEITNYYYDYDALYKDPEDDSSEAYNDFIKNITTSEHTELLMRQQTMYEQMWGE